MSVGSVVLVIAAVAAVAACIAMLRAVSRPAEVSDRRPVTVDLGAFQKSLAKLVSQTSDAALRFVLRARLEAARRAPEGARRLQLLALLCDLEHHDLGRPPDVVLEGLAEPLALVGPERRDGIATRELWGELTRLTADLSGPANARRIMANPPVPDMSSAPERAWSQAVENGRAKAALATVQQRLTAKLGEEAARDLIERACRAIGSCFPLACLPGFLGTLEDSFLVTDRAFAQDRAQLWEDFLSTRRSLAEARMHLAQSDLQKWASVGRLAAGVGHEINNPLTVAVGNSQALRMELEELGLLDDASRTELLDDLELGLERISSIVRDLQVFSRGGNEERRSDVSLDVLVESMVRIARPEIRGRAEVALELGNPPPIYGDEGKLGQVIVNLLVNAAQACESGGRIVVRTGTNDGGCFVEVIDDGPGIAEATLSSIFDPFFTTKDVGEGTGLGLAISREIAERHEGSLDVESTLGEGARFRLWLPQSQPAETTSARNKRPTNAAVGLRVLIVDDEPGLRRMMRRYLGQRHEVSDVDCGEAALELLEKDADFDVILLDIAMPGIGGRATFEALPGIDAELSERVVFLSGGATDVETGAFLERHSDRALRKPISPREVETIITRRSRRSSQSVPPPQSTPSTR